MLVKFEWHKLGVYFPSIEVICGSWQADTFSDTSHSKLPRCTRSCSCSYHFSFCGTIVLNAIIFPLKPNFTLVTRLLRHKLNGYIELCGCLINTWSHQDLVLYFETYINRYQSPFLLDICFSLSLHFLVSKLNFIHYLQSLFLIFFRENVPKGNYPGQQISKIHHSNPSYQLKNGQGWVQQFYQGISPSLRL